MVPDNREDKLNSPAVLYTAGIAGGRAATWVSDEARHVLGYEPAAFADARLWASRIHPEDAPAFAPDWCGRFEYRFLHADGSYRWLTDEIRVVRRDELGNPVEICGYLLDVTTRIPAERSRRTADSMLEAVRLAAERCLGSDSLHEAFPAILKDLALAAGAAAVRLLQHHPGSGDRRSARPLHRWPASQETRNVPWRGTGFERWADLLDQGHAVHGPADSFPAAERAVLASHEVRFVGVLPVHTGKVVWGSLHFDGLEGPWTPAQLDALAAAARIVGASIQRQQAAGTLRWREAFLVSVAECSPLGVYLVDQHDGAVVYLNRRFRHVWRIDGQPRSHRELVAHCLSQVKDPASLSAVFALDDGLSPGASFETEIELADGRVARCISRQVRDAVGGYLGHLHVVQDVTEWRQAEEALRLAHALLETRVQNRTAELAEANKALRESEALYRSLVETSPDCICLTDSQLNVAMYNRQGMSLFGLGTPGEAVGMHLADFVCAEDPAAIVNETRRRLEENGSIKNLELALRRLNGNTFPAEISASTVADGKGGAKGVLAIIRDVSERKQVERALQASEKRFRAVFDEAPMGIGVIDRDGRVVESNYGLQHLLGYTAEEFRGIDLHTLMHPHDHSAAWSRFEELLAGSSQRYLLETRCLDRQGRSLWIRLAVSAIHAPAGEDFLAIAMFQDITEQKLLEDQIRQATKMEAIGRLAGGIAHDFNNLLTVIKGYSDLILKEAQPEDRAHRRASQIRDAAQRAATLVEQLLAFSRKQVVAPRTIHLNTTVTGLESMLRRLIGDHIELTTRTDPEAGYLEIDPGQLEQVIMNLAVNARDAMPDGGQLTIATAAAGTSERAGVTVSVSDSGIGMTEEVRSHIFEPFFTTKEVGKGTGLGLSTVYGIIRQARGHISVTSEPGHGTTFRIWFPAVQPPEEAPASPDEAPAPAAGVETILVCEDEEMVRSIVCDTLREQGYRVMEARDGSEALRLAEEHSGAIDLLLTDMVMPRMGGQDLSQALAVSRGATRVLFMSGHTQASLGGRSHFMKKPFSPDALLEKVRAVLDAE